MGSVTALIMPLIVCLCMVPYSEKQRRSQDGTILSRPHLFSLLRLLLIPPNVSITNSVWDVSAAFYVSQHSGQAVRVLCANFNFKDVECGCTLL
jgi:hypothetical protein